MEGVLVGAVVQQGLSTGTSWVLDKFKEKATQKELMERLEIAYSDMAHALEISGHMPITSVYLLGRRRDLKHVFKECGRMIDKHKHLQMVEDDEDQQMVPRSSSSALKKILHAVKSPVSSCVTKRKLRLSAVARFEFWAKKARELLGDVESSFSVPRCRFFSHLITQLFEGKTLEYCLKQGSQVTCFYIQPTRLEGHGIMAHALLEFGRSSSMNFFRVVLVLRLYESTDIAEITIQCLKSLGTQFKPHAEAAMGQVGEMCALVLDPSRIKMSLKPSVPFYRPDPLCCIPNGLRKPCASNILSSELTGRFPEQAYFISFTCYISVSECNIQRSIGEVQRNSTEAWPTLKLSGLFYPHLPWEVRQGGSLHQTEEKIEMEALDCFSRQPEQTEYDWRWASPHGCAQFIVSKLSPQKKKQLHRSRCN